MHWIIFVASSAFYLIEAKAVFVGTNLTWDGCTDAINTAISDKVNQVSKGIITGLSTWKDCKKPGDIVLLTQTGQIGVLPDKVCDNVNHFVWLRCTLHVLFSPPKFCVVKLLLKSQLRS